jgi:hypothetical protein
MASHRTTPTRSTAPSAVPATRPTRTPAAPSAPAASQQGLKRAALSARVSTEKQEREETVASQVDLLYQAAAASGYDIAPTSVFLDEGVSGARLDRPALDRLRDLAAEGAFEVLLVTVPDRLARRYASQVPPEQPQLRRRRKAAAAGRWRAGGAPGRERGVGAGGRLGGAGGWAARWHDTGWAHTAGARGWWKRPFEFPILQKGGSEKWQVRRKGGEVLGRCS